MKHSTQSNTAMLMAIAAGLGSTMVGSMAENYDNSSRQKPSRYADPKGTHEQAEAMAKAEAKRQRKAAKRRVA